MLFEHIFPEGSSAVRAGHQEIIKHLAENGSSGAIRQKRVARRRSRYFAVLYLASAALLLFAQGQFYVENVLGHLRILCVFRLEIQTLGAHLAE